MPIRIPDNLPAVETLQRENIFVMQEGRAVSQDIRPLQILLVNLMPKKIDTETQISRILGNTPLQIDLELVHMKSHTSVNTTQEHLRTFYKTFDEVKDRYFDGCIITGAAVELLEFEDVDYWDEICDLMQWTKTHVHSTFHICWAAQAGLYYHYGIQKHVLPEKISGVFRHGVDYKKSMLFRGFDDIFYAPHSRGTTVKRSDIEKHPELRTLASSPDAGVYAVYSPEGRQVFIMGHSEYDADTLKKEYLRDLARNVDVSLPRNYFPFDDETLEPLVLWRAHANLLYSNWLNYFVYQTTPYNIDDIETVSSIGTENNL